jgi:hypothetical protein
MLIPLLIKGSILVCGGQIRHFEHAWLKESWATYMEAVWLEDSQVCYHSGSLC